MTLTKEKLSNRIYEKTGMGSRDADHLIDAFFQEISEALVRGEEVKLASFGVFHLRDKDERPGRNPKTGEQKAISARRVVTFKASGTLKGRVEDQSLKFFAIDPLPQASNRQQLTIEAAAA